MRVDWRCKSKPGRPPLPMDLRALIRRMALENPTWGQERIADELVLKLREAIPSDHTYRILTHDRDWIFSKPVEQGIRNMGLRVLKTPVRTPAPPVIGTWHAAT